MRGLAVLVAAAVAWTVVPAGASVPPSTTLPRLGDVRVSLHRIANVRAGTAFATRKGDPTLYLTTKTGTVVAVREGRRPRTLLDLSDRVATLTEQGLLGLTFSPRGTKLYLYYTGLEGSNLLEEYRVHGRAPARIDAGSRRVVLSVPHPGATHNGGQLVFGRDGMLYLGIGDGGGHKDTGPDHLPGGNAQSLDTLLGKILRIDPRPTASASYRIPPDNPFVGTPARPEIWAYGLRNPWRFSFDRETGDLWIADVGEAHWEEIDHVARARLRRTAAEPLDFGWNLLEGTHPMRADAAPGSIAPVHELAHAAGNCAVIGGFVYRGSRIGDLRGTYVFSDLCGGELKGLRVAGGHATAKGSLGPEMRYPLSLGQDDAGELYVLTNGRGVFRVDPA